MTSPLQLDARELDALQEVASIGCGHALTALGRLLARRLDMDVPEAWVGQAEGAITEFLACVGARLLAVAVRLEGLLEGELVLALPERDAARLATALGHPAGEGRFDEAAESVLLESGNIVGSAFVSAIAGMVHGRLLLSVPRLARGGARDCLAALLPAGVTQIALATRFSCAALDLEGLVLVLPRPAQVTPLLARLRACC
ncbi:MAG TPA: chemotaxis protein CheC [Anaeromyxobacteraceae bacterium]|jgi:chemotaxis protein CheC|nr:chemotaxis protein CheC [Anaeromyxobacteraceae bacterium]